MQFQQKYDKMGLFKKSRQKSRMKNPRFFVKKIAETIAESAILWYNIVDEHI